MSDFYPGRHFSIRELELAQSHTDLFVTGLEAGKETAQEIGDCIAGSVMSRNPNIGAKYSELVDRNDFDSALAILNGVYAGVEEVVRRSHV